MARLESVNPDLPVWLDLRSLSLAFFLDVCDFLLRKSLLLTHYPPLQLLILRLLLPLLGFLARTRLLHLLFYLFLVFQLCHLLRWVHKRLWLRNVGAQSDGSRLLVASNAPNYWFTARRIV